MRALVGTTVMMLIAALLSISAAVVAAPAASAVAGTPGVAQAPTTVYTEDFQNRPGPTPVARLSGYTGTTGQSYTANPAWLTACNGWIASANQDVTAAAQVADCASQSNWNISQQLAQSLGLFHGESTAVSRNNYADTAYTANNPGPGLVEFQTATNIPFTASNRFITFSVDVAAVNCAVSAPLLQFSLLNTAGVATAAGTQVNACTSPTTVTVPALGVRGATTANVGTYGANGAVLFSGSSVGVRMVNNNGSGQGNDHTFDNIKILDVTPQLDKEFSPTTATTGGTSTLTFTVTNTSELAAKNGWSFTDTLPANLVLATPTAQATTCPAGVITATSGGSTVGVKGNLTAGMTSCTVTVKVTSNVAGTYTNDSTNVTTTGLNAPGPTSVTFASGAAWTCSTYGYLFQTPSTGVNQVYQVDLVTGASSKILAPTDNLNATGYNTTDNYIYASDINTGHIVKVASDGSITQLPNPTGFVAGTYNTGDFDSAGHYWVTHSQTTGSPWYEIDYAAGSPTFGQILATGTTSTTVTMGGDWVYVNGGLYSVNSVGHLIKFDLSTHTSIDLGAVPGIPTTTSGFGAGYADAAGNLYVSNNDSGEIYRVNVVAKTSIAVAAGPPSGFNDGARCATAPIPTVTVTKTVAGRSAAADQFTVGLNRAATVLTTATTVGTATTASTTDWPVSQAVVYTVTDKMAAGSTSAFSLYTPTIACTDSTGAPLTTGGTAGAWTFTPPGSDAYTCNVTNSPQAAAVSVLKLAGTPVDVNRDGLVDAGDSIAYTFTVTNTGGLPLTSIAVTDNKAGAVTCPAGNLAVGASVTCTANAPYTITAADQTAGAVDNSATAAGTPVGGTTPVVSTPSTTHTLTTTSGPAWGCTTYGYLFQGTGGPTSIYQVDLVSGASSVLGTISDQVNALGYNPTDNYVYGTDWTTGKIVKISYDGTLTQLPTPGGLTFNGYNTGDMDDAGHYWVTGSGTGGAWREIDYTAGSSTYGQVLASGTTSTTVETGPDWVYVNGALYSITAAGHLSRFDASTHISTDLGTIGGLPAGTYGAGYADAAGNTYFSNNTTGQIYRVDVTKRTAISLSAGPSSTGNDGARCASAPIPTVTVTKTVAGRLGAADQFTVGLTRAATPLTSATTVGTATTASTTDWPVSQGTVYTVTDAMAAGSPNALASYTPTVACTDSTGAPLTTGGTAGAWTFTPPGGGAYTCNVTNTPKVPSIGVVKHAGTPVDVNGDKLVDAGDSIAFTFTVTNTGPIPLQAISVTDNKAGAVTCPAGTLAAGASVTCSAAAPYTITAVDQTAGAVDNSATAAGTPVGGTTKVVSPPSTTHTPTVDPAPAITVVKSANPSDAADFTVDQVIVYSFVITNTGNVTLTDVKPVEGDFTGSGTMSAPVCPVGAASLAPAAQVTCTATYTVTQDDVDAGSITNNATATGTPPNGGTPPISPPTEVVVPGDPAPAITVVKSANPATITAAGQSVTYSFLITNTGNVTLTDVHPTEGAFSGDGTMTDPVCPAAAATLTPGAQVTCTATYVATQKDVDTGTITNTATATGTPPNGGTPPESPPSKTTVTVPPAPGIKVVKTASPSAAAQFTVGQVITYSFVMTNTGNVTLTDVKPIEGTFTGSGTLSAPTCPAGTASLAPAAQVTCTATYTVTQEDVDAGQVVNDVTATGTPPTGPPPVSPPAEVKIPSDPKPAITVAKDASPAAVTDVGQTVTYSFLITNTGNVTLKNVTPVESDFTGTGTLSAFLCPAAAAIVAPGASITCTATYLVTQADLDAGDITNTATATGTPPPGGTPPFAPPSIKIVHVTPLPALTVVKSADPSDAAHFTVGQVITYSFVITNTGNVTLADVHPVEGDFSGSGKLSDAVCPVGAASLAPRVQVICTASYTLTQADVDSGKVTNIATATGTPPNDGTPPESPPTEVTIPGDPKPALTVVKSALPASITAAGQTVTYTFLLTNTGNVTLKDVHPVEGKFSGTGALSAVVCAAEAAVLAPGAEALCTATYVASQADVDAGTISNTATGTGTPPDGGTPPESPPSTSIVPVPPTPGITVVKSAAAITSAKAGDVVTYSFLVTNTGNVTLKNVHPIDSGFTGTGKLGAITCPAPATLAPTAQLTCTADYTLTQADINTGSISNSATATGTPPGDDTPPPVSPPSDTKIPLPPAPGITVVKSATPSDAEHFTVGQVITYSFLLTNTGNVTLKNVHPTEGDFTGSGTLSAPVCPAAAAALVPAAQVTCTATYTITQADVDAGKVTNNATATGTPPTGTPPVSPPTTVVIPNAAHPSLTLVKTSSAKTVTAAGQKVSYSFLVTNTGNVTINNVSVVEGAFSGTGTLSSPVCPNGIASLAPGASVTCTADYTTTQADVASGALTNTATVTGTPPGTPPGGPKLTSVPSTVKVPVSKLGLVKTATTKDTNGDGVTDAGDTISWTLVVTNLGTLTVDGISISDPTAGKVTCPATTLAVGALMTCTTAGHVITAADAAAGTVVNTAVVTGIGIESGTLVSPVSATATVAVQPTPPVVVVIPPAPLASTGISALPQLIFGGTILLLLGGFVLLMGRRRNRMI